MDFFELNLFEVFFQRTFPMGPPQFHTPLSSTHQFVTKGQLLFSPQNSSVSHQFNTKNPSVQQNSQTKIVLNWGVFGVELRDFGVELRSFRCWSEGLWVLESCGPCVEPMCWTEVCVELRGTLPQKEPGFFPEKFWTITIFSPALFLLYTEHIIWKIENVYFNFRILLSIDLKNEVAIICLLGSSVVTSTSLAFSF